MEKKQSVTKKMKTRQLAISRVVPGMVTAKDVYARNDQLIIHKGIMLDSEKIAKLMFYAVESVFVFDNGTDGNEQEQFSEKLVDSMEFRQFSKKYDEAIMSVRDNMNSLLEKNVDVDQNKLLMDVNSIVYGSRSKMQLLSMLHCIRNYDDLTYMHCVNVALICNVFGDWLGLSKDDRDVLTLCGLLHDIGKILIPKKILVKPDKLTDEEFAIMKKHTELGYGILKDKEIDNRVKLAALYHHERYDGSGYQVNLMGDDIDTYSMIVAIADVYDAMTSSRVYRGPVCPFDVLRIFEDDGYIKYDPKILIPLMQQIAESYVNHTVRLSNDMQAEIIMLNRANLSKPIVKVDNKVIDLSKTSDVRIETIL